MGTKLRKHLSFANVTAVVALFVALGGASYAAINLPKNSVGASEIEKNAVKAPEIARGAVRGDEVKDGGLSCSDFDPVSPACAGLTNTTVRTTTAAVPFDSCNESNPAPGSFFLFCTGTTFVEVPCNAGERATGGGYAESADFQEGSKVAGVSILETRPNPSSGTPAGWTVKAQATGSNSGASAGLQRPPEPQVTVHAVCAA